MMTPDGRFVVFASSATNLVSGDTNSIPDVFERDMLSGTTTLVSVGATPMPYLNFYYIGASEPTAVTPDGRFVAFASTATNLVSGVGLSGEVYVRDLQAGSTTWASTNARSMALVRYGTTNAISSGARLSDDGRWVTFVVTNSAASSRGMILTYDMVSGGTTVITTNAYVVPSAPGRILDQSPDGRFLAYIANNPAATGYAVVFLYDALLQTNILVSADQTTGLAARGLFDWPAVDAGGRYVTFSSSTATNLAPAPVAGPGLLHIYQRDVLAGMTEMIDVDTNGVGVGAGENFSASADGHTVVFEALTNSYFADDLNGSFDVVARDLLASSNELVSARHPALPTLAPNNYVNHYATSLNTNARYVAFVTAAGNLMTNDVNNASDVFVRDAALGRTILASFSTNGGAATGASIEPAISGDGRLVAYTSFATNIVVGDTNRSRDIFLYDLLAGTNALLSKSTNKGFGSGDSYSPKISTDGSLVLFSSKAANLAPGPFAPGAENLFVRNLLLNTNYALTTGGVFSASMTLNGRYVAFVGVATGSRFTNLYVWDSVAQQRTYTNSTTGIWAYTNLAISPDGRWLAYADGATLNEYDLVARTNLLVMTAGFDFRTSFQFSADARFLVFATRYKVVNQDGNNNYDVYLHDFLTRSNILVSHSCNALGAGNQLSDSPSLSPDGRFVAYRSLASDLIPNDTNSAADIFVYDRITQATWLITAGGSAAKTASHFSRLPVFSGDGKCLVFASYANDLLGSVFNQYNAIYALDLNSAPIVDTDDDQMDDDWEMAHFETLDRDGSGDADLDGGSDLMEFLAGTDPNDPNSVLRAGLSFPGASGQSPTIVWPASQGKFYRVQYKDDLTNATWSDIIGGATQEGNQGRAVDLAPAQNQRFYRVLLNN
jgi:hypothetical protein